jgi:polyisoprenoid-binding protein YceI
MNGNFRDFGGALFMDPKNVTTARGSFSAKTASIDTANEKRDGHLRSPDFFDTEKWPEITFVITSVEAVGAEAAKVKGDFTMRGVTKPVEFDVKNLAFADMGTSGVMGFTGTTVINRDDFGMTWNKVLDIGGLALGKDVTIDIAVEAKANLAPPEAAAGQ